ncbi:MAG: Divalent-cation tolerance protein CutA [Candidatus Westeberhardia cardiocondylae]|nr:Divalent-cation tolerance protein CutA [Candidatus Westeberhardia cardiocondylae]
MKKIKTNIKNKNKKQELCIVLCTTPNKKYTNNIIKSLLKNKLATCITTIPNVISTYYWKNTIQKKTEEQLIIKTTKKLKKQIILNITKQHPYNTPEILFIPITDGNKEYLSWIKENLKKTKKNNIYKLNKKFNKKYKKTYNKNIKI